MNDTLRRLLNLAINTEPEPTTRPCWQMVKPGYTDNDGVNHLPTYCDKDAIHGSDYCDPHTPKSDAERHRGTA